MNNDVLAEAILHLASAIEHISVDARSQTLAGLAKLTISSARTQDNLDALTLLAKSISDFRAALSAAGCEADAACAPVAAKPTIPAITAAMSALAGRALQMRDDRLNVLMFEAMVKLNAQDIKEWLAFDVQRSAGGNAVSGAP